MIYFKNKKIQHFIFTICLFLFSVISLFAQQNLGKIKGKITTTDGEQAVGVNIILKNSKYGTVSNEDGVFEFNRIKPNTYTLEVSLTGYETVEKEVIVTTKETSIINVQLNVSNKELKEVVINSRKKYKRDKVSNSLRIQTPIIETPQSIIAIDSKILEDQQVFTITDVARNVSGVTSIFPYVGVYTDFSIRGSRATNNRLRNGMSPGQSSTLQEDMSYVESVEFIKGPAGFMLAQGEPGGIYNVVTKKPLGVSHAAVTFNTGSFGLFRTAIDIGSQLGEEKKMSYRLNVMNQNSGTHLDNGINDRISVAPVIRYDIDEKTAFTLEYNYDHAVVNGTFNSLPTKNGKFLPRNFMLEDPTQDPYTFNSHFGFVNLTHKLTENWKLTAQIGTSFNDSKGTLMNATAIPGIDNNGILNRNYSYQAGEESTNTAQLFLNGNLKTGNVDHKILVGFDGGLAKSKSVNKQASNILPIDTNNPQYGLTDEINQLLDEDSFVLQNPSESLWQAFTFQDDIKITKWAQITLGGRYTEFESGGTEKTIKDKAFTPRAGLIVKPLENTSIYFLYDQSFLALTGTDFNGNRFKPLRGNNIEIGAKKEWFDKKLFTQMAVYNITKENALTTDPLNPNYSIQRGEIKYRGVELDVLGSITNNLDIVANYAYLDAKITKDTDPNVVGTREQGAKHTMNLWAKYQFEKGALEGFGFGLGGAYHIDRYVLTIKLKPTDKQATLDDFKSLNAALYYKIKKISFALNLDNITNQFNYIGISRYDSGSSRTDKEYTYISLPGANWRLSVSYKF